MEQLEKILNELCKYLENFLAQNIKQRQLRYQISGEIEILTREGIINFFKKEKIWQLLDYYIPKGKNEFPDLRIKIKLENISELLFFESKAADSLKDPENDLGTLRNFWKTHVLKDVGLENLDNLFMIFVKYSKTDGRIAQIDKVYIAHYFKFIGSRRTISFLSIYYY
jgi:hypothetical protein